MTNTQHHNLSTRDLYFIGLIFIISRIFFYLIGYFGALNFNVESILIPEINLNTIFTRDIWNAFCQFDCSWFKNIVDLGYETYPHGLTTGHGASWAFFPFYSKLGGIIGNLFNLNAVYGFYIITNISTLLALVLFYLCIRKLSYDVDTARFGVLLLAFSPYSVYLVATYTESTFLLFTMVAFLGIYSQKWFYTLLAGVCMTATRNVGVMMVFPVLMNYIKDIGLKNLFTISDDTYRTVITIMFIPLPIFAFMYYLYHLTGDAFAFKNVQIAWNRIFGNPIMYWTQGFSVGGKGIYLSIVTMIGWLINLYLIRKKHYSEALFMFICTLIPLTTSINAMPRYIFGLYPTYLAITIGVKNQYSRIGILLCSTIIATFMIIAWVNAKFFTT